ncbi:MAG: sulfatase-like hydrolase/transferase [Verrucomicrobiota bacterium]
MKRWIPNLLFLTFCCWAQAAERPNIVFILTDDQRDNSFSGMGHPWVKTPHVDQLLTQSTRFQNAYIAEPTCKPSRAAIYLGCHERVNHHGFSSTAKMNAAQWADSFPALLQKAGYRTGFTGKWHISNSKNLAFEDLFDYVEGHLGHGPFFFAQEDGSEVTTNFYYASKAIEFLESTDDAPFFLSVCLATPHGSKVAKMHKVLDEPSHLNPKLVGHPIYGGMYRDLTFPIPIDQRPDPYEHVPTSVRDQEKGRNTTYRYNYTEPMSREHHYRYFQMVTEIDQMVSRIVQSLESLGLDEKTILIFGSDHGLLMGEYGMGGKGLVYDLSCKFPCFIYDPSSPQSAKGQVRDELVSSLDLSATILDYAGLGKAEFMDGRSLKPLVQSAEPVESWRIGLFLENLYTGRDTPIQAGYVANGWKYIQYHKAPHPYAEDDLNIRQNPPVFEQLFDLKSDPGEVQNLIANPEAAEVLKQLRHKTRESLEQLDQKRSAYHDQYLSGSSL